jgi:glycosyltransferase involved in cell wall biosynthesis
MVKGKKEVDFSVLLPVYYRENPEHLRNALASIWDLQSLKPAEIVLVKDGPLTNELNEVISTFSLIAPVKEIALDKNFGLGIALNIGLAKCRHELVARMDSDDISVSHRFEKQSSIFCENPELDVIGSNIAEFDTNPDHILSYRVLPEKHLDILAYSRRRNPINHMTAFFRKSSVLSAGGYLPISGYEDYHLWARLLLIGARFYNIQENLVLARTGDSMIARRQGKLYFHQEIKFQNELLNLGFLRKYQYYTNLILRAVPRILPLWALKKIYKLLRKK